MKRPLETVLFFCLTLGLFTSGTTEKRHRTVLHWNSFLEMKKDSTDFISFIKVDSFDLTIFPPSSGVQFYKNEILFLSPSKNERNMLPRFISFGRVEAYYAIPEDSVPAKHMIFSHSYPFTYPCEAVTFSPDFNTMYFTKFPKKEKKEKIYLAKYTLNNKNQSGWFSEINPLDFCSANSTYTHPSLSVDEKILVFASDKEGSLGGMDLFITRKETDKWSAPENLGNLINSSGNEFFPFLDQANNLFFSSDGLPGYGGYDVFTCRFNGKDWDGPINLSRGINSGNDDVAFTLNRKDGKLGFFTTIDKTNKRRTQLYKVTSNFKLATDSLMNLSDALYKMAQSDTTFSNKILAAAIEPEVKKTEPKAPETTVAQPILPEKKPVITPEPKVKPPEAKVVIIKPTVPTPPEQKDIVFYRVQFLSSVKPQGDKEVIVNGKSYKTYEYLYLKEYRYTIGKFYTLKPAIELQNAIRRSGNKQAFVAAFKNNTRSLDLALFK